jgi:hypothetical protein
VTAVDSTWLEGPRKRKRTENVGCFERKDANGNWSDPCRFGDEEQPLLDAQLRRHRGEDRLSTALGHAEPESTDGTDAKAPRRR